MFPEGIRRDSSGFLWSEGPSEAGRKAEHSFPSPCLLGVSAAPPSTDYSIANVFIIIDYLLAGETNALLLPSYSQFPPIQVLTSPCLRKAQCIMIQAKLHSLLSQSVHPQHHTALLLGYFIAAECSKMVCHLHVLTVVSWRNMLQNAFSKSL